MKTTLAERWQRTWRAVSATGNPASVWSRLEALYSEPHRAYHNLDHIADCLDEFDGARHLARQPICVELAIWYHDAIYDPRAGDNEERSAVLAEESLQDAQVDSAIIQSVGQLILATKAHESSGDPDAPLLIDVDLSILGRGEDKFDAYESGIRKEYAWVPEKVFREKRAEILERFLARSHIYNTDSFRTKFETQARANLRRSIDALRKSE